MDTILTIDELRKGFNKHDVLKGVSLEIPRGVITIIIGGSGCGKSVLLKHIIGILKPDSGRILLESVDLTQLSPEELLKARMRFGMLFQDAALFDSMNVYENISFPLREHRKLTEAKMKEIVAEKLAEVGLSGVEKKYPSELSGGMRKRVGLARAIVLNPEIILYDEPTTGLDPILSRQIDDLIVDTQRRLKATTIIISHDIRATLRIANKIAMLHDGVIVAEGSPSQFYKTENPLVRQFLEPGMKSIFDDVLADEETSPS